MSVKEKRKSAKQIEKEEFEQYLNETRSWETSKVKAAEDSKRTAWRVAAGFGAIAGIVGVGLVFAVVGLIRGPDPALVRVDSSTGLVDVVKPMKGAQTNYDEVINKFFVQRYVRFRENYSRNLASEYYSNVGLLSSIKEQQRYLAFFEPKNPNSPLNVYGDFATVNITIKSTSFIKPDVALVRYVKEIERGSEKAISHWAATVTFTYIKAPISEKDREINPLGFSVLEYRNDPEGVEYEKKTDSATTANTKPAAKDVTLYPSPENGAGG